MEQETILFLSKIRGEEAACRSKSLREREPTSLMTGQTDTEADRGRMEAPVEHFTRIEKIV